MNDRAEIQTLLDGLRDNGDVPEPLFRLLELIVKALPFSVDEVPTRPNRRTPAPFVGRR
jgi:hypothetical protein